MWGQCIDLPLDTAPEASPPTTADEQSISLRCLWVFAIQHEDMFARAVLKASCSVTTFGEIIKSLA